MAPMRKTQHGNDAAAAPRRASGALESTILTILWEAGEPLSPSQVRERLAASGDSGLNDLAYTTVVTILTRLHEKNALTRQRDGRAFRYAPVADEAGLAARRLSAMLDQAADRHAVLSSFVNDLSDTDEQLLRALLGARTQGVDADPAPERG